MQSVSLTFSSTPVQYKIDLVLSASQKKEDFVAQPEAHVHADEDMYSDTEDAMAAAGV